MMSILQIIENDVNISDYYRKRRDRVLSMGQIELFDI